MDDSQLLQRLSSLSASAEPEQIDRGVSLALWAAPAHAKARKRFPRKRSLLIPIALLVLGGSAGIAVAELTDEDPLAGTGPGLTFYDAQLGRHCAGSSLAADMVRSADASSYVGATVRCEDGTDPGLAPDELADAERLAIEKTGTFGIAVSALPRAEVERLTEDDGSRARP